MAPRIAAIVLSETVDGSSAPPSAGELAPAAASST
jgi:hypothetical protein